MARRKMKVVLPPIDADPEEVVRALFRDREVEDLEPATEVQEETNDISEKDA